MKRRIKKGTKAFLIILCIVVLILSAVAAVFLFNSGNRDNSQQSHEIFFQEDAVTVEKYETYTLELLGTENKEIEWKSNDEEIATVENGVVCGWKKGHTQIFACVEGMEISCNVVVSDNQYVPVVDLGDRDELTMDIGGAYALKPVLYYNGNAYTDVEYTYSSTGSAVTVDESGAVTAAEVGETLVCVEAKWRRNVIQASMAVRVIDASTSIEVSDKEFNIYYNGRGAEYPASVDLGISVFDKDEPMQEQDASIAYTELIMEGDLAGAVYVENGVAYAAQIGTTHFIAEYTPAEGVAVRSAVFAVNVHQSPYDKYMKPIEGAEYESFITPMNPMNTVEWDDQLGAFHLTNINDIEDDGRAFLFSREYIENIIRYTNAKSIVFEVKRDGIDSGSTAPDEVIYQGFYPEWYDAGDYMRIDNTGEWTKIEIFFDEIPLDKDGNRKAIMLLSTKEGMYIRNIRPMTEGLFLTMDLEFTTLGGNWSKDIEIGAFPHSYEGSINGYSNRATIKANVKTTVKYRLDDFLENGKVPGFGLVVFGGPAWDAKLPDGYTPDRHTLKITNLRVTGEQNYSLDLGTASWTTGKNGTGFTDANGSGTPTYEEGAIIITNGFCYDGHKFTLDSEEAKNRTYIYMDMEITTLGNSTDPVEVRFYPYNFEGSVHESFADKVVVTAGKKTTVKLNLANYLVNGEFPGIGVAIFGGPTWDAKLADGYTPDRHTVTISNMRLEGKLEQTVDLSKSSFVTGFADSNSGGVATVMDGTIVFTGGFCYDGHMITFVGGTKPGGAEPSTYINLDLLFTTLSNSTDPVEVRFYPHNFEGSVHESFTDKVVVTAGKKTTIKLNLDNYLIDGKFTGIGCAIFGGPEWNTQISDGVYDRHTVIISNVRLEGKLEQSVNLHNASIETGFADSNSGGTASVVNGTVVITGGFCYDGHMITFGENKEPEDSDPSVPEKSYICVDLLITTLGNSTEPVDVGFFPYKFEGDINDYTDKLAVTAGTETTVKLDLDKYLVDGELTGIGFAIFGGPEWDAKLEDGYTPDRHTITISGIRVEGGQSKTFDLNKSVWASGTNGTGFINANGSGVATIADGIIVITNGFRYDGHKLSLSEMSASDDPTEPPAPENYINLDLLITTLGNSTDVIEVRFYRHDFAGNAHEAYTDSVIVTAGTKTAVKLELSKYLVDGKFPGIGVAVFGGPQWNTQLPDGTYDRHSVTVSNIRLEGAEERTIDLSNATVVTGFANTNSGGTAAVVDGTVAVTDGYCYDGHMITFGEETEPETTEPEDTEPETTEPETTEPPVQEMTTISMDLLITTLGNSTDGIEVRFYRYDFAGNAHEVYTDSVTVTAGTKTAVNLELEKYLVDGEFTGIGVAIFGGPQWNTQLPNGTYDRHSVTVSNLRLEGAGEQTIDLSNATVVTGFANTNSGGTAAVVNGTVAVTGGYCYDGHMITFGEQTEPETTEPETTEPETTEPETTEPETTEPETTEPETTEPPVQEPGTYICVDMLITTLGGSTNPIEVRFYPYSFEGSVHNNFADKVMVTAGTQTTVKLELSKYLVDGELTGIGFAIFGGPTWDAKLPDGYTPDRHTITISSVYLEGEQSEVYDLSKSVCASGTNSTGYTDANGSGTAAIVNDTVVITNGFCYDGHKLSLVKKQEAQESLLCMDLLITTLGNSTDPVDICFYPHNFSGNIFEEYTEKVTITAGQKATVKLDPESYLVDGELPGIGVAIFGGPTWDAKLPDGYTPDRHTLTISNMHLQGDEEQLIDLNKVTIVTGFANANGSGTATIGGEIVITNGFRYDGHMLTFGKEEGEQKAYISMDILVTTLGNSTAPVDVGFFPHDFEGDINNYAEKLAVTAGTTTTVKLELSKYLVDGKFPGIGFAIFGGPTWDAKLPDGYTPDRHTITISNVKLEGALNQTIDLSTATCASGTNGTGYSNANGSGAATIGSEIVITNGFRYDGHKLTFGITQDTRVVRLISRHQAWILPPPFSDEWSKNGVE